jgi:D-alanine-D-alanine ligase and related ATP-grasp enzymes
MKIWVLHGGEGAERDVSLRSGAAVTSALLERGWDAEPVDLRSRKDASAFIERKDGFAFIALHGGWGEDGTLQAALEMAGIPFPAPGTPPVPSPWTRRRARPSSGEKGDSRSEGNRSVPPRC